MRWLDRPGARPSTETLPAALGCSPSSTFTRVDLPTPFGPRTATNSPGPTVRSTPLQSVRPATLTAAPRSSRTLSRFGVRPAAVPDAPVRTALTDPPPG